MIPANELDVLIADTSLTLAGVSITVHEYTLSEQLQHRQMLKAITAALKVLLETAGDAVPLDALTDALAGVADEVIAAVAVSCGQSVAWVSALTGEDADTLLYTWWSVNAGFFTRQVLIPALEKIARQTYQDGGKSSQRSFATDTPPANSGTTPPVS